jgi:hypothetical protein
LLQALQLGTPQSAQLETALTSTATITAGTPPPFAEKLEIQSTVAKIYNVYFSLHLKNNHTLSRRIESKSLHFICAYLYSVQAKMLPKILISTAFTIFLFSTKNL